MDILKKNNIMIIGNGFDLAHGIKSSYKNFITTFEGESLHFKYLKETCQDLSWIDVEKEIEYLHEKCSFMMDKREMLLLKRRLPRFPYVFNSDVYNSKLQFTRNIREMTTFLLDIFQKNGCERIYAKKTGILLSESNYNDYYLYISEDFALLEKELTNYLANQTGNFESFEKLTYFEKMLNNSNMIFTYNYTMTIEELYKIENTNEEFGTNKIKHMHGDLLNKIVLGTPYNLDNQDFAHLSKNLRVIEENTFLSDRELKSINKEQYWIEQIKNTEKEYLEKKSIDPKISRDTIISVIDDEELEIPNLIIVGLSLGESDWYTLRKLIGATKYPKIFILYHSPNSKREIIKNLSLMLGFEEMNSLFSEDICKLISYEELSTME